MNTLALSWSRTRGESHFLGTLRSIYCVTKLKFIVLRLAISPTLPFECLNWGAATELPSTNSVYVRFLLPVFQKDIWWHHCHQIDRTFRPLSQIQVIFRGLSCVYLSHRGVPPSRWTPSSVGPSQVGCTSQVGSCKPLVPSSTRALQLDNCRKEVSARLRPPRHSRCLAKGALLSLPPPHWHHCLSPARRCSHSVHHSWGMTLEMFHIFFAARRNGRSYKAQWHQWSVYKADQRTVLEAHGFCVSFYVTVPFPFLWPWHSVVFVPASL